MNINEQSGNTEDMSAENPSDNPAEFFDLFSIPSSPNAIPDMEILTTESAEYLVHIKAN